MEWLRPPCVVWKFGDDPSRFIEWIDLCCSGGGGQCYEDANIKLYQEYLTTLCIDAHSKHTIRTKACEAFQDFPISLAIYPRIHGKVAIENQPRWIINANALDSNHPHTLVEVNQIGERDFLIKYICEQKWGGFARLMEVIHSLGLQTVEVNVTTSNGIVLNSFKVDVRLVAILSC
ncbi:hypothetical protein LWI28_018719 [Acer negundo]|uniref:Plant bHLH transcription factor ACT-like domain-containing protein n=1 Tax=Acer negundo TaxID=4023 RepID=A0AAD5P4I6_ACENE|nr:hypothetical protein LWI28_018719 [Acer negundo]